MPGYGLPQSGKGLLPWKWAEQRLKESHNYWISTTRPDGAPHTMIVWGLWRDGAFYFSTGQKSRKARNLARNPRCVVCTERAEQAVIVEGTAEVVRDRGLLKWFNKDYETKYKWDMSGFSEPIYRVRPRVAFGLYEKDFVGRATRWKFRE
jgi:PPOX class probable F420-dependent enzyme